MSLVLTAGGVSGEAMGLLARALFSGGSAIWNSVEPARRRAAADSVQLGDLVMVADRFDADGVGWLREVDGDRMLIEPLTRPGERQGWRGCEVLPLPPMLRRWLSERSADLAADRRADVSAAAWREGREPARA